MIDAYNWEQTYLDLFSRCLERFRAGEQDIAAYYDAPDRKLLDFIGYQPREFFDFVEDYADSGDPTPTTAVMIASARRDYFHVVQDGRRSGRILDPGSLPPKQEELDGISWLPRIIVKAEAKLRGELDPDIMYSCGGDRAFLRQHRLHPAEFLRTVWAADGDQSRILSFVRSGLA